MRHFPSPDIGMFGRRLRHPRGHRIPVTIVTGAVAAAQASGTVVVIDTFDADEAPLSGGCACCTVRVGLQRALRELQAERERGRAQFSRIVIETRGDLGPILRTFATERALGGDFFIEQEPEIGSERFTLTRDAPLVWDAFSRFIAVLTALRGTDLTRTEGLLNVAGCRGPVIVRYRQHLALQPAELAAWSDDDRRSRITFVTRDVERQAVESLFTAVQALSTAPGEFQAK